MDEKEAMDGLLRWTMGLNMGGGVYGMRWFSFRSLPGVLSCLRWLKKEEWNLRGDGLCFCGVALWC